MLKSTRDAVVRRNGFYGSEKPLRHDEVKQRPQFLERILQRRSSDEHPVVGVEIHQNLVQQRIVVLQSVSLVDTQNGPAQCIKQRLQCQHMKHFDTSLLVTIQQMASDIDSTQQRVRD